MLLFFGDIGWHPDIPGLFALTGLFLGDRDGASGSFGGKGGWGKDVGADVLLVLEMLRRAGQFSDRPGSIFLLIIHLL